jgi:ATP-dependent Clp protease protease subunit
MIVQQPIMLKSDLERGFYFLQGEVNDDLFTEVCEALTIMEQCPEKEITLAIKTLGGCVYSGLAIFDRIKMSPKKVNTLAIGETMSAGTIILQAGHKRLATKHAQLLFHSGYEDLSGTPEDNDITRKHFRKIQKQMVDIYAERSHVGERAIKMWLKKDTYFTAEEALSKGLIDEVVK